MHKFKKILLFFIIVIMAINLYSQEAKKSSFGIQYTLSYDFYVYNKNRKPDYIIDVLHHAPAFSYRIKNHNLYIGPLLSHVFQPKPIGSEKYDNKAFGLHFGYTDIIRMNFFATSESLGSSISQSFGLNTVIINLDCQEV